MYRERIKSPKPLIINALEGDSPTTTGDDAVGEIFAAIDGDRTKAASKTMAYLDHGGSAKSVFDAASKMIFHKGTDSHDYKYGAAIWEDFPRRRPTRSGGRTWPRPPCSTSPAPASPTARS